MKNTLTNLLFTVLLAALPVAGSALPEPEREVERSCEQVENMLRAGDSPAEVVTAMVNSGMTLTGATVFAMECAPEDRRQAIAQAGVELAPTIIAAESVVAAVNYAYGEGSPEVSAAHKAAKQYKKTAGKPREYEPGNNPGQGAGVSPS
jgi:hypothetical protein